MNLLLPEYEAGLDEIRRSPRDAGVLRLIVRRPKINVREVLEAGVLDVDDGLIGDRWADRGGSHSRRRTHPDTQLNVMNARVIALLAGSSERWSLAGDQLYVDLDLSEDNLPSGTRLEVGTAVIEVTAEPHTGCGKFAARFGTDAVAFVNSPEGRRLRLRGLNARVVRPGAIRVGDAVTKST